MGCQPAAPDGNGAADSAFHHLSLPLFSYKLPHPAAEPGRLLDLSTGNDSVPTLDSDRVFQSYGRCCNNEQFFIDFYEHFMSSSPVIRERFKNTDMPAQRHLLRNGIMQLVLFARGMPASKLHALGESHSRRHLDIDPKWYANWVDALMNTLRQHDPQFDAEMELVWRRTIQAGVDIIRDAY